MRIISFLGLVFLIGVTYAASCTTWTKAVEPTFPSFKIVNPEAYSVVVKYEESTSDNVEVSVDVCDDSANVAFDLVNGGGFISLKLTKVIPSTTQAPTNNDTTPTTTTTTKAPDGQVNPTNVAVRMNPLSSLFVVLIPLFFVNRRLSIVFAILAVMFSLQVSHAESTATITITIKLPVSVANHCDGDVCKSVNPGPAYFVKSSTTGVFRQYIAIDASSPYSSSVSKTQSGSYTIPSGWAYATEAELIDLAGNAAWPSTECLVGGVATAIGRDGKDCDCKAQVQTDSDGETKYVGTKDCGRVILSSSVVPFSDFKIGMKVVVISPDSNTVTDAGLMLAITMLRATGIPYDLVPLMDSTKQNPTLLYPAGTDLPLYSADGTPKYYGIVTTRQLLDSSYANILTVKQQEQIAAYKRMFGVREVLLDKGLAAGPAASAGSIFKFDATWFSSNSYAVSGLRGNATFDVTGVAVPKHTVNPAASDIKVVARYYDGAGVEQGALAAVVKDSTANTETMEFYLTSAIYLNPGPAAANVWINWLSRGVWVGSRRTFLSPQIDDLFLGTEEYKNTGTVRRMTDTDLVSTRDYLKNVLNPTLPAGSNVTLEFGFNCAEAIHETLDKTGKLMKKVQELVGDFFWESHTWSHLDLTFPDSDSSRGYTTYGDASEELVKNIEYTRDTLFKNQGGLDTPTYSKDCMITPKISGMNNTHALKALVDNGITCVVGDNSVPLLQQENPYLGEWTTKGKHGYDGVFIIPRFATEIYYDTATESVAVKEFNDRYGANGSIVKGAKDLTLEEIMEREAAVTMRWLSQFRHDPYMFHQGNLVHFTPTDSAYKTGSWSLITLWIDHVVKLYTKTFTFPVVTTAHKWLRDQYMARRTRDECGIEATLTISKGNKSSVKIESTGSCEAGVTGLPTCATGSTNCRVEAYGPDNTLWAKVTKDTSATAPSSGTWKL